MKRDHFAADCALRLNGVTPSDPAMVIVEKDALKNFKKHPTDKTCYSRFDLGTSKSSFIEHVTSTKIIKHSHSVFLPKTFPLRLEKGSLKGKLSQK